MASRKQKREKRNKIFIGFTMVIFLVSGAGSFVIFHSGGGNIATGANTFSLDLTNGRYDFELVSDHQGNSYYQVSSDSGSFIAFNEPDSLAQYDNEVFGNIARSGFYYLTFDPKQAELSQIDYLRFDLEQNLVIERSFSSAVIQTDPLYNQLPIITCDDATNTVPVVFLRTANFTKITNYGNCAIVEFSQFDLLRIRDLLIYSTRGIDII